MLMKICNEVYPHCCSRVQGECLASSQMHQSMSMNLPGVSLTDDLVGVGAGVDGSNVPVVVRRSKKELNTHCHCLVSLTFDFHFREI